MPVMNLSSFTRGLMSVPLSQCKLLIKLSTSTICRHWYCKTSSGISVELLDQQLGLIVVWADNGPEQRPPRSDHSGFELQLFWAGEWCFCVGIGCWVINVEGWIGVVGVCRKWCSRIFWIEAWRKSMDVTWILFAICIACPERKNAMSQWTEERTNIWMDWWMIYR